MLETSPRSRLAHDLVHRLSAALGGVQLYAADHPLVMRHVTALVDIIGRLHATQVAITIGIIGDEIIVDNTVLSGSRTGVLELLGRFRNRGIERVSVERGVEPCEVLELLRELSKPQIRRSPSEAPESEAPGLTFPHIRVGRLRITAEMHEESLAGAAALRQLYAESVATAAKIWKSAEAEKTPDPGLARGLVDGMARAVVQHRTSLLALVALKQYENYTFTHMVNVAILTLAQARALGLDGALLREFGLAGLMHDIGKIRVPHEVLTKTDKLTDEEFLIMKRHPIDGAEMLRGTKDIPHLAPIVAFEHHLRLDGTGYPDGVKRGSLNLATMLCSIGDVYDAMRSQRQYQEAFPTDRILAVYRRADGQQFDQHLVRRFVQLLGIYPPGNLVKLSTGEIAVVVKPHAPDPYRPKVRLLFSADGEPLSEEREVNLWEAAQTEGGGVSPSVVSPIDPADYAVDPLTYL